MRHITGVPRFILGLFLVFAFLVGLMAIGGFAYARGLSTDEARNAPLTPRQEVNKDLSPSYDGWDAVEKIASRDENITSLNATLIVPSFPATDHDQTVFVFSGLSGSQSNTLLQPVLQYGRSVAGGTRGTWSMGAWAVTDHSATRSDLSAVRPGDHIVTRITHTSCGTQTCSWVITMTNARSGAHTSLTARLRRLDAVNRPQALVVETYGMHGCSDLPHVIAATNVHLNSRLTSHTLDVRNAASGECGLRSVSSSSSVNLVH